MLDRAPSQGPVTANVRGQPSCLCQITTITDGGYPGTFRALLRDLMVEVVAVGQASGVQLDEKFADDRLAFCDTLPAGMTSSMHNDLEHGHRLELPWLSGGVASWPLAWESPCRAIRPWRTFLLPTNSAGPPLREAAVVAGRRWRVLFSGPGARIAHGAVTCPFGPAHARVCLHRRTMGVT
ncbi:ketopantoate reductase C-terminal domain-containing protein [Streptomyces sp. NPDC057291]|uniref:ketopantoate reductase C-terminal domain-containing protein n=1 Tax=Streptomyces sp. NPDC057291 TaxID=3346087 RepID=UPI003630B355